MKRSLFFTLILTVSLSIHSCSKDDSPPSEREPVNNEEPSPEPEEEQEEETEPQLETIFTYNANTQMIADFEETWILLHDEKGNLIDYKQEVSGESLIFEAMDTLQIEELSISKFVALKSEFSGNYIIYTYGKVSKGQVWNEASAQNQTFSEGHISLTVSNIENWEEYSFYNTDGHGRYMDRYFQSSAENDNDPTNLNLNNFAFNKDNNNYLLSIIDADTNPKYMWINDIEDGQEISIDGSTQLKDFETIINLPIPETATGYMYSTSAIDKTEDINLQLYNVLYSSHFNNVENIKLGYLEEFDNFHTGIGFSFENYNYYYSQPEGMLAIENINPVEPQVTFEGTLFSDFSFSSNQDYVNYKAFWSTTSMDEGIPNRTVWDITSPNGFFPRITEFPEELKNKYPALAIEELELSNTTLYLKNSPWSDYISGLFGTTSTTPTVLESVTVSQN